MTYLLGALGVAREIKNTYGVAPQRSIKLYSTSGSPAIDAVIEPHKHVIEYLEPLEFNLGNPPANAFGATGISGPFKHFVPLEGITDRDAEKARLAKELARAEGFAAAQEKKLGNESFVKSAPAEVVEGERAKLQTQRDKIGKLKAALRDLG